MATLWAHKFFSIDVGDVAQPHICAPCDSSNAARETEIRKAFATLLVPAAKLPKVVADMTTRLLSLTTYNYQRGGSDAVFLDDSLLRAQVGTRQ